MGDLLNTIGSSVGPVGNITVILAIIVYMFAVVGMQLFKSYYKAEKFKDGKLPRWNFDDFGHSFMVIFRILCGKWIEPLWWTMKATSPAAIFFILPAFVIGNFVILNLFLALLLNSFSAGGDEPEDEEEKKRKEDEKKRKKKEKEKKRRLNILRMLGRKNKNLSGSRSKVGPDEEGEGTDVDAHSRTVSPADDGCKKEAAIILSNNPKNGEQENGYEMTMVNRLPNGQTQQENFNGFKYGFGKFCLHLCSYFLSFFFHDKKLFFSRLGRRDRMKASQARRLMFCVCVFTSQMKHQVSLWHATPKSTPCRLKIAIR